MYLILEEYFPRRLEESANDQEVASIGATSVPE
jgi:hypothetical protein